MKAEKNDDYEGRPPYIHVWKTPLLLPAPASAPASPDVPCPRRENADRVLIFQSMIAGGLGGTTGDMLMHSLDTVKTRQQGDPHLPPKYTSLGSSYYTILRQEGVRRGLYGGWFPALLGSFPGTVLFFGTYEFTKRNLIDRGMQVNLAYLTAGTLDPDTPPFKNARGQRS